MRLPRKTKKEIKKISACFLPGNGCIIRIAGKPNRRTMKLIRLIIHERRSMLEKLKANLASLKERFNPLYSIENECK